MFEVKVGETKRIKVQYSDGVNVFPLPGAVLWTVASGFGNVTLSGVSQDENAAFVDVTGNVVGQSTVRASMAGYANADVVFNVVLPNPSLRISLA